MKFQEYKEFHLVAFNRTNVELKWDGQVIRSASTGTFNRTNVELKYCLQGRFLRPLNF
jgi:hypothetical protein